MWFITVSIFWGGGGLELNQCAPPSPSNGIMTTTTNRPPSPSSHPSSLRRKGWGEGNELGKTSQLAHLISQLPPSEFRAQYTSLILTKLHAMGLVAAPTTPLSEVAKLSVSKFARRRLAVVMARTGMVQNIQTAIKFVEQGHVRVGSEVRLRFFFPCLFLFFGGGGGRLYKGKG
jgi:hypothetical protein